MLRKVCITFQLCRKGDLKDFRLVKQSELAGDFVFENNIVLNSPELENT